MSGPARGLPLLSGIPPPSDTSSSRAESSCRKCNKEFNLLFTRPKRCNHCGYAYCSSCTDHQALCPRGGREAGYDMLPVCSFCIEMLTITASPKAHLRSVPVARLRKYLESYNIPFPKDVLEKDELIDYVIGARGPNGCLAPEKEEYYRRHSVPNKPPDRPRGNRNIFTRSSPAPPVPPRPRPSGFTYGTQVPQPPPPPPQEQSTFGNMFGQFFNSTPQQPPPPPPRQPRPPPVPPRSSVPPQQPHYTRPQYPQSPHPPYAQQPVPPPRPASTPPRPTPAASPPRAPPLPVPTIDALLSLPTAEIASLPISTLKAILFANHVNSSTGVLEKEDLVNKVRSLVDNERREREREEMFREMEEQAAIERQREMMADLRRRNEAAATNTAVGTDTSPSSAQADPTPGADATPPPESRDPSEEPKGSSQPPESTPAPPPPRKPAVPVERTGLCVVCQDEEANVAIVDCGHLALCMHCSDLVMSSTRECPLCRQRIVTEARLLRIYKT